MVSIDDVRLEGAGFVLKQHIWNAARDTIQEWTGQKQVECSLYGVRIYYEGSVLATHVDRLPLGKFNQYPCPTNERSNPATFRTQTVD